MADPPCPVPKQSPLPSALLAQHLDAFLKHCDATLAAPTTIEAYRVDLCVFAQFLRERACDTLSLAVVSQFLAYLKDHRANAPVSIQRKIASLNAFFSYLVCWDVIPERDHPLRFLPKLAQHPNRKLPVVLSASEVDRLLAAIPTDTVQGLRDRAIITLFYATGVRVSELCTLKLASLDFEEGRILVHGKGDRERYVPIPDELQSALRLWLDCRPPSPGNDALFLSKKGNRISQRAVQDLVRKYANAAGLPKNVSPHKLRHTCATQLLQRGAKLTVISELLGHQHLSTTQIYLHVTLQEVKEAMAYHPLHGLASLRQPQAPLDHRQLAYQGKYQRVA